MPGALPNLTPREAARLLGISYPTIKQWILAGKLKTKLTPGGHHRISQVDLKPFLDTGAAVESSRARARFRRVSGRNQLIGKVVSIQIDGLLAQVMLKVGNQQITAIITADAVREMALRQGDDAAALMKATEVMIERL